ncbi:hypothetical protein EWB00_001045 [Schistosoma japonicum]|uniref:SJCHGC04708 protein n=1 Tax=Schistosoma japonicum TaxID=6182 RepID=Q5DFV8_SCHJA|nr:SJCHGC04708 protein [Schistosoma japonicum]KAH8867558.1 Calcium channel flower [Schistosoma japonicum]TNN15819.1 hypothetical protein EWB00_001045 [Schistosoma japonicum]
MAISPKLIEYGLKAAGIATAVLCFSMGVVCLISISAQCIVGGLLLILIGIVVIILEAPICCSMVPQLHKFNEFIEKRSPIEKSIFYGIAAILPLSLCFGISTLFCGLALGACCAFNVWRIIKERRNRQANPDGAASEHHSAYTANEPQHQTFQGGYGGQPDYRDQLIGKAAVGAVKGVISGSGSGGYPGTGYSGT